MNPLSFIAGAVSIITLGVKATQSLVDFYSAYKSQTSDITQTLTKLEHLLGVLETLTNHLANRKFSDDEQDLLKTIESLIRDCEECIQELQSECDKFKAPGPSAGIGAAARSAIRRVAYPFRQSTLQKLDENVEAVRAHLSLALDMLQQKDVSSARDDIEDTKALLDLVRASQISSAVRDWLKAPDAAVNYNEACKKRHSGTGLWFVKGKGSAYAAWLVKPNSFLWLNGFAGCGKSILCSTAIQYAFRHRRSNQRIGIAFFFFSFNDAAKQDTSAMLRALVLQLSGQCNDNHGLLSKLHDSYRNAMPPDPALMGCLRQLVQAFDDVCIILDALDESPRDTCRGDVLQALVDMRAWSEPGLHLLVTSREEPDIRDVLRDELGTCPDQIISMKNDSVNSDIASFISGSLSNDRRLRKWDKYHEQIKEALTERANGVFRWVECQFTALVNCPRSKRQLDTLLASLPRSLDKTYEQMLLRIGEESVDDARRILTLLCCAKRPLTVPELIDGIAVDLGANPRFDPDGRLDDEDDIYRVCPGLIEVNQQPSGEPATVHIAHFSVQEYLESDRICQHKVATFSVRRTEAHAEIACICLTYLLEPTISIPERSEEYAFALYAAKSWPEHFHDGGKNMPHVEQQALRLFQSTRSVFENWVRIWGVDPPSYDGKKPAGAIPSPLYYASRLGLDSIVAELLCEKPRRDCFPSLNQPKASELVNALGGLYGTALQAASAEGYEAIVKQLLEKGADVNVQGGYTGSALQAASAEGHEAIVEQLLEKGADVNAQGGYYGGALQAASAEGHEAIVEKLLEKGADINTKAGFYGTALHAASDKGHEVIVKLLLENGADVTVAGSKGWTPLYLASRKGHVDVVKLLLKAGANVAVADKDGGTPLISAASNGYIGVVKLLLEAGAGVAVADNYGWTPLYSASSKGYADVVKLLLEAGADVAVANRNGWTPLGSASQGGYLDVVKLLLENGADVTVVGSNGWTPLHLASKSGHVDVVKLLFRAQTHLGREDSKYGRTAMSYAARNGHEAIVRLFLRESTSDPNSNDHIKRTALSYAAMRGHENVVTLLLMPANVSIDAADAYKSTPLSLTVRHGHAGVTKLLLATNSVNLNSHDCFGRSPLWYAKRRGHATIAGMLLKYAAEQNIDIDVDGLPSDVISEPHFVRRYCEICTFGIPEEEDFYQCESCNGGDFDICQECHKAGGPCLVTGHELVQRPGLNRFK